MLILFYYNNLNIKKLLLLIIMRVLMSRFGCKLGVSYNNYYYLNLPLLVNYNLYLLPN